ncbi:MAG: hypothetical protein M3069_00225 [Chloroflexota bacterium]|nr:hypothetical protein [Chloroflexota bacterium]
MDSVNNLGRVENSEAPERWAAVARRPIAAAWLKLQVQLGLAPRTIDAYGRGLADYLTFCGRDGIDPLRADRAEIARWTPSVYISAVVFGLQVGTEAEGISQRNRLAVPVLDGHWLPLRRTRWCGSIPGQRYMLLGILLGTHDSRVGPAARR